MKFSIIIRVSHRLTQGLHTSFEHSFKPLLKDSVNEIILQNCFINQVRGSDLGCSLLVMETWLSSVEHYGPKGCVCHPCLHPAPIW